MTVGIALACHENGNFRVVVAADRMMTAKRELTIEYEHPGSKLTNLAPDSNKITAFSVYSGSVSLADEINETLLAAVSSHYQKQEEDEEKGERISVRSIADKAASEFNLLVQKAVQYQVLGPYGFQLSDLSKQHQFKDGFFQSLWQEVTEVQDKIDQSLRMLIVGVDDFGPHIYEIRSGDVVNHNSVYYASTGSGAQAAESEFIRSGFSINSNVEEALGVVTAAKMQAEDAPGVGEEMDISVGGPFESGEHFSWSAKPGDIDLLRKRELEIRDKQSAVRAKVLANNPLNYTED